MAANKLGRHSRCCAPEKRDTTPAKFGTLAVRYKGGANSAGLYCTNLSRLAEELGKEEDICSNDPIASFCDCWKKWRIGRSSDNRALRYRRRWRKATNVCLPRLVFAEGCAC